MSRAKRPRPKIKARVKLEPLPCPCCGGTKLRVGRGAGWVGYGVHCLNPECGLSVMRRRVVAIPNESTSKLSVISTLEAEAIQIWNKRNGVSA